MSYYVISCIVSRGDTYSYQLLQVPEVPPASTSTSDMTAADVATPRTSSNTNLLETQDDSSAGLQSSSATVPKVPSLMPQDLSGPATRSMYAMNKRPSNEVSPEEQFLAKLAPVAVKRSIKGKVEFKDLFIPPPPAPSLENLLGIESSTDDVKSSIKMSPKSSPSHTPTDAAKKKSTQSREKKASLSPSKSKTSKEKEKLMKVRREKHALIGKL